MALSRMLKQVTQLKFNVDIATLVTQSACTLLSCVNLDGSDPPSETNQFSCVARKSLKRGMVNPVNPESAIPYRLSPIIQL